MSFDLAQFQQEIEKRKQYIDTCLQKYLTRSDAYPPIIHEAMHYAIFNGGKRLRPIMVLRAKLAGASQSVVPIACALEMIHSIL